MTNSKDYSKILALRGQYFQEIAAGERLKLCKAVTEYVGAMQNTDPDSDPELFYEIAEALCEIIPIACCLQNDLAAALHVLSTRFKDSAPGRPSHDDATKSRRNWLRALILIRFGSLRRAERLLALCREDFARQLLMPQYLVSTLDLGELYLTQERYPELQRLSADALFRYRSMENLKIRGTLLVWRDGTLHEDLTIEAHRFVRQALGRWVGDGRKESSNRKNTGFVSARDTYDSLLNRLPIQSELPQVFP